MPKFEAVVTEKDKIIPGENGQQVVIPGRVYMVPVDDAAKITQKAGEALRAGVWTPKDPKERENGSKRLAIAHVMADIKLGRTAKDDYDTAVTKLMQTLYKVR